MPTLIPRFTLTNATNPGRPWVGTLTGPAEVTGDQMVAAMDAVGVDGAICVLALQHVPYDARYALEVFARGGRVGLNSVSVPIDGFPANYLHRLPLWGVA